MCPEGGATLDALLATFQTAMVQRTSPKPGADSRSFAPEHIAAVTRFFASTFFQHWRLYSHCLRQSQHVVEQSVDLMVRRAGAHLLQLVAAGTTDIQITPLVRN